MSKKYNDPIQVEVGPRRSARSALAEPLAFSWKGRRYSVQRLIKYWRESSGGWDSSIANDTEMFRVEADGGTYDLLYDRIHSNGSSWRLRRVWD